jgi:hypothetical protein
MRFAELPFSKVVPGRRAALTGQLERADLGRILPKFEGSEASQKSCQNTNGTLAQQSEAYQSEAYLMCCQNSS